MLLFVNIIIFTLQRIFSVSIVRGSFGGVLANLLLGEDGFVGLVDGVGEGSEVNAVKDRGEVIVPGVGSGAENIYLNLLRARRKYIFRCISRR